MVETIPEDFLDLFEKKTYAHLATLMPDGSPQVTPLWVDFDGEHILVNNPQATQKSKNMAKRPKVALSIPDPDNPFRVLLIRGAVIESIDGQEAEAHIDKLSQCYSGGPYQVPKGSRRLHKIELQRVIASSPRR